MVTLSEISTRLSITEFVYNSEVPLVIKDKGNFALFPLTIYYSVTVHKLIPICLCFLYISTSLVLRSKLCI